MKQPTRLFDLPEYQLAHYPLEDMLAAKENGEWKSYSTQEVIQLTRSLATGLLRHGIGGNDLKSENQDKVGVISANRPEWVLLDLACQQIGAVLTPIYPTINEAELEYILMEAEVKMIFVGDEDLFDVVNMLRNKTFPGLEIFSFDQLSQTSHWTSLCKEPSPEEIAQLSEIKEKITPQHLATIIYTSGTTGTPKGVMLSHDNLLSNVVASKSYLPVGADSKALSFLPLNHVYERMITFLYIYAGVSIYYAENMNTIGENLKEVKPSIFTTVPRLLEKVYETIMSKGIALTGIKKKLFFWAVDLGSRFQINTEMGGWYRLQLRMANKLIFNKWREGLGGNVQAIVTGSAACQIRLLKLFTAAGINVLEGYGLTETSPVISVNRMEEEDRMFGSVGPVIDQVAVRIADDGEILCKGPNIMMGYYKQPGLTETAIIDGWFHTGDIGELVENKFLKITDRKKEMFKTSGGKYVAPLPIENKMKESSFIEQIIVMGANLKYTSALIVPNFSHVVDWCKTHNVPHTSHDMIIKQPEVIALIHKEVEKYNQYFSHVEQIKKFELLPHEWTIEGSELTPTLKLKRNVIKEKYKDIIAGIYT